MSSRKQVLISKWTDLLGPRRSLVTRNLQRLRGSGSWATCPSIQEACGAATLWLKSLGCQAVREALRFPT